MLTKLDTHIATNPTLVQFKTGAQLAYELRGKTAAQRAIIAANLAGSRVAIEALTNKQYAALCDVSVTYFQAAAGMARDERRAAFKRRRLPPSHAHLEQVIRQRGVADAWDVIETLI